MDSSKQPTTLPILLSASPLAPPDARVTEILTSSPARASKIEVASQTSGSPSKQMWDMPHSKTRKLTSVSQLPAEFTMTSTAADTALPHDAVLDSRADSLDSSKDVMLESQKSTSAAVIDGVEKSLQIARKEPPQTVPTKLQSCAHNTGEREAEQLLVSRPKLVSSREHESEPKLPKPSAISLTLPLAIPGLTNPIHPLFGRHLFLMTGDGWYQGLEQALRLATRLLAMDSVVKHIVVMTDGELRRDTEPWGAGVKTDLEELADLKDAQGQPLKPNVSRHPKPDQETVNDSMRTRANKILSDARLLIRYRFDLLDDGTLGQTMRPPKWTHGMFQGSQRHRASFILIQDQMGEEVAKLSHRRKQGRRASDVEWDLHIHEIMLATTLLHEVFHALDNAHNRPRSGATDTFYGDCRLAECGHAGVAAAFGGIPRRGRFDPDPLARVVLPDQPRPDPSIGFDGTWLELTDWPGESFPETYKGTSYFGTREGPTPLVYKKSLVSMSFVEDVFRDEYWEIEVPKLGQSPLHVPGDVMFPIPREARRRLKAKRAEAAKGQNAKGTQEPVEESK